jgi:hypothetical protein
VLHAAARGGRVAPMGSPRRAAPAARPALAVALACLICAALSAAALGATVIHFQRESLPALETQLHRHEVHALAFHPTPEPGHVHVSLDNGRHMTVTYVASDQATLVALARSSGAPVAIAVAKEKKSKAAHHKLRYIAAGILIVVIIVVTAVLLVDRRRRINETDAGAPVAPSSGDA